MALIFSKTFTLPESILTIYTRMESQCEITETAFESSDDSKPFIAHECGFETYQITRKQSPNQTYNPFAAQPIDYYGRLEIKKLDASSAAITFTLHKRTLRILSLYFNAITFPFVLILLVAMYSPIYVTLLTIGILSGLGAYLYLRFKKNKPETKAINTIEVAFELLLASIIKGGE